MVAVEWSVLEHLSGGHYEAKERRVKIELDSGPVYFFESYKNLDKKFWKEQYLKLWDLVPNMPNYSVGQLSKAGYDIIEGQLIKAT